MERTLKMPRILLRSDIQVVIFSLSLFAWKSRQTAFHLRRLTISFRTSPRTLRL